MLQVADFESAQVAREGDRINEIDREFHMTIAAASQNKAIIYVVETMWRLRLELPDVKSSHSLVCRKDGKARQAEHSEIVEALKVRDSARARGDASTFHPAFGVHVECVGGARAS